MSASDWRSRSTSERRPGWPGCWVDQPTPRSNSSQLYVSGSPLASVADPVSANGVLAGMVKPPAPTEGTGMLLPVAVMTGHELPLPTVV